MQNLSSSFVNKIISHLYFLVILIFIYSSTALPQDLNIQNNPFENVSEQIKERNAFLRERWFYEQRMFPNNFIPKEAVLAAQSERIQLQANQGFYSNLQDAFLDAVTWENIGPTPGYYSNYGNISSRITTIQYDPTNPNIIYLGAAFGGIWKSTNGGDTWVAKSDNEVSLASGSIAVDPTNSNIIYYGTGEATYSAVSYYGRGLLKSTDGGNTWTNITAGLPSLTYTSRLVIRPNHSNELLAAMGWSGLYRSTDSGINWTQVISGRCDDVVFSPEGNNVYAVGSGVGYSISSDGGATFSSSTALTLGSRNHIALCKAYPNILYFSRYDGSDVQVFKSSDFGNTFTQVSSTIDFIGKQAWYDFYIHVNPFDPDYAYVGSIDIWRTTDGGTSFQNITGGYSGGNVHVDQHNLAFHPTDDNKMVCVNDGGVWRSNDRGTTWTNLNASLTLTQFYRITSDPSNGNHVMGGTQDNGSQRTTGATNWSAAFGGDGGEVCFQSQNSNYILGETQRNGVVRSTNNGASWMSATSGLSGSGAWVGPLISHPSDAGVFYTAREQVFKSTDWGASWIAISSGTSGTIREMAISKSSPNIMYATSRGSIYKSTNSGTNYTNVTSGLPTRTITSVYIHPEHSDVIIITFSGFGTGHIYKSIDGAATWQNITGNLPDAPVNDVLVLPKSNSTIYINATDVGVYISENEGDTWIELAEGLPNSVAMHLDYNQLSNEIFVGTHGRGVFKVDAEYILDNLTPVVTLQPESQTKQVGETVSFRVEATCSGPLGFQWWSGGSGPWNNGDKNGRLTVVNTSNSSTLTITNIQYNEDDQNNYLCEVKNLDGYPNQGYWINSNTAILTAQKISSLNLIYNQIDDNGFPAIESYVTVSDLDGNPIAGLTSSNFTVNEDNVVQTPITVTTVGSSGSEISASLVVDKSASMSAEIGDAKTAAIGFVNNMQTGDKGAVVSFGSTVVLNQGFTTNKTLLINAINSISASDGSTRLYDGIYEGISQTSAQSGRKAVISLSDGGNNAGTRTEADVINYANQLSIPVFTIGLGLSQGSADEQSLKDIATQTGGQYYYAPNSSDLSAIYQSISQSISSQYKITYTSSDAACGGSLRTVSITADYNGAIDEKTKTYTPPACGSRGSIKPVSPTEVLTDNEFWLDIKVGDPTAVSDLFGVSFKLNYETAYLDFVTAESNIWFGNSLVFYSSNDDGSGEVSIGISRKSPESGVNGSGVIARVKFIAISSTPHNTQVTFSISDLQANNPNGIGITLTPLTSSTTILSGLIVWPGDTDNDGEVDQADVLPLGLHWSRTGTARSNASMQWIGQTCPPWTPEASTYADCNGDGVVNQAEVLAIGLNWSQTHTLPLAKTTSDKSDFIRYEGELTIGDIQYFEDEVILTVNYLGGLESKELLGLSYEIKTSNGIELVDIEEGEYFGEDVLGYLHKGNTTTGYGIVKKSRNEEFNLQEPVSRIRVKMMDGRTSGTIELLDIKGINRIGRKTSIKGASTSVNLMTSVKPKIKLEFGLKQNYPNPFNPSTTLEYSLAEASDVRLSIYNMLGEEIHVLVNRRQNAGRYSVRFDGSELSSGIYLYKLLTDKYTEVKKLILVK